MLKKNTPPKKICNVASRTMFVRDNWDVLGGVNDSCIDLIRPDPRSSHASEFEKMVDMLVFVAAGELRNE